MFIKTYLHLTLHILWTFLEHFEEKNVTIYHLIHKNGINSNTINRINASITTYTLDHLCQVLGCSVQDIIAYTPDDDDSDQEA